MAASAPETIGETADTAGIASNSGTRAAQLAIERGRCARQGDPGSSQFFLSLEDDLMRLFLQGNLASRLMEGSMQEGEELEHPWLNRSIESAQKKVEQQKQAAAARAARQSACGGIGSCAQSRLARSR